MRALQRSWDSVSEPVDESRNVECQGTVVDVDSDDEFFVRDTQMDSDDSNAPLVRSGRFAALSMSVDEHQFADAVRAPPGVCDHGRVAVQTVHTRGFKRLRRTRQERVSQTTTVALPESIEEALQFDLTQHDSDVDRSNVADQSMRVPGQCGGESDTDSVGAQVEHVPEDNRVSRTRRRRRLTLVSSQAVPDSSRPEVHARPSTDAARDTVRQKSTRGSGKGVNCVVGHARGDGHIGRHPKRNSPPSVVSVDRAVVVGGVLREQERPSVELVD